MIVLVSRGGEIQRRDCENVETETVKMKQQIEKQYSKPEDVCMVKDARCSELDLPVTQRMNSNEAEAAETQLSM